MEKVIANPSMPNILAAASRIVRARTESVIESVIAEVLRGWFLLG
jgi:hypothetical protein